MGGSFASAKLLRRRLEWCEPWERGPLARIPGEPRLAARHAGGPPALPGTAGVTRSTRQPYAAAVCQVAAEIDRACAHWRDQEALLGTPAMQAWTAAAVLETEFVQTDEPCATA